MPLISDFLDVLSTTWGKWSLSTKFAFKQLTGKKHVSDASSVHSVSTEVQRDSTPRGGSETLAETDGKPIRRRSVRGSKPTSYLLKDVASHDKPHDCWIVIKEKVCSLAESNS